jgi:hypothetical protein
VILWIADTDTIYESTENKVKNEVHNNSTNKEKWTTTSISILVMILSLWRITNWKNDECSETKQRRESYPR